MKALALTSAAALFALAAATHADAVHADGGINAGPGYGYEEVNPKVGRMPILDPQPNTREFEAEINPKIGTFPVVEATRATDEGWVEVNPMQGRVPSFKHGGSPQELAGL